MTSSVTVMVARIWSCGCPCVVECGEYKGETRDVHYATVRNRTQIQYMVQDLKAIHSPVTKAFARSRLLGLRHQN